MGDTFYLFAEPSFVEGMSRALDLGATLNVYNESPAGKIADSLALSNDWSMVGKDIQEAILEVKESDLDKEKE